MEANTGDVSININNVKQSLRTRTEALDPLSGNCCIYKVPPSIREANQEKFTPKIVSIGPFHHGMIELQPMEEHKCRYLSAFLDRTNLNMGDYVEKLEELQTSLRASYVDIRGYSREKFMEIMAVDGAFLMEFLLRYHYEDWKMDDQIYGRQMLLIDVVNDLLLIENQLPFFYLEHLFRLFKEVKTDVTIPLWKVVEHFIRNEVSVWDWPTRDHMINENRQVHRLLHFLLMYLQQSENEEQGSRTSIFSPTISNLHGAGVKFKPSSTHCLSGIKFANGIMEIPKLSLADETEMILRNMQAFEHCHKLSTYVRDYICFMDVLVNDEEDMKLLVENKIIDKWLEDNKVAAKVFNNLGKGNVTNAGDFFYAQVMEKLNAYYKKRRHKWMASLKQKYFNNPWTLISVIAASFLLILTITQTVCSILQVV